MSTLTETFGEVRTIVIYDTEFTTWEGALERGWSGDGEHRELVQIAAARVDLRERVMLETFEQLVKPRINPELSPYFTNLTHITQADIETAGVDFTEAFQTFREWCGTDRAYSYSKTVDDYTDADVLRENIALYNLPLTVPEEAFGLLTPVFQAVGVDTTAYNSGKLYQAFGLTLEQHHEHNAMDDVHSLVQSLFAALEQLKSQS